MRLRYVLSVLALVPLVQAGVVMPSWFSDYMVLQANNEYGARAFVNGLADPGESVVLTDSTGNVYNTVADSTGQFVIQLYPQSYSLYHCDLSIVGEYGPPVVAHNVSWGEVLFCAGQSNMVFPLSVAFNYSEETGVLTTNPNFSRFHFFMTGMATIGTPQWNTSSSSGCSATMGNCDQWMAAPEALQSNLVFSFSAVCYISAKTLQQIHTTDAPYGLIQAAWDGSQIEAWMPEAAIKACIPPYTPPPTGAFEYPTYIYNGMVHPFKYMTFRAIIWYQGEANSAQPPLTRAQSQVWYTCYLQAMIKAWRDEKGTGDVPFLVVQLPPSVYNTNATTVTDTGRQQIRLAQKTVVPRPFGPVDVAGIAVTVDLGGVSSWGVDHPPDKNEMGRRTALMLAHVAFGVQGRVVNTKAGTPANVWESYWTGPVFSAAEQDPAAGDAIVISFDEGSAFSLSLRNVTGPNAASQVKTFGAWNNCTQCCPGLPPFEVSYNYTSWVRIPVADVALTDNATTITLRNVAKNAVSLRYAWADFVDCVLVNGDNLPAGPFVWNFTNGSAPAAPSAADVRAAEGAAGYTPLRAAPTKPAFGYNTWNYYHCNIDENSIRAIVDAMVANGMKDAGFEYVNIDDCWQVGRMANGTIIPDPVRFPSGMKAVADYAHSKGMKFGVYTSRTGLTCQKRPGSYGYEAIDAQTYCDWGVDYVKIDDCGGADYQNPNESWSKFRDGFDKCAQATGRYIWESVEYCKTAGGCGEWIAQTANSWRTTSDIQATWASMMSNAKLNDALAAVAVPGHYNDADALEVGNPGLSLDEQKVHMTLWILITTPLLAATNVMTPSAATLSLFTNKEALAIAVDLGADSKPQGTLLPSTGAEELWVKHLNDKKRLAVAVVNTGPNTTAVEVSWAALGLNSSQSYSLRDLWGQADLGIFNTSHSWTLSSHSCVFVLFAPSN
ncbi:putative alpha-galactosidase [Diplonema papillatum]|nr:putative alpha-galactosidase [Diplonema papillatum]